MKLLWLCNNAPGLIRSHISGRQMSAVNWMDHVLDQLRQQGVTVRILFRGSGGEGAVDEHLTFSSFPEELPSVYRPELEESFREELRAFQPDVIHSWGVEYDHALAMVNAAEQEGMLPHMAASIQGLCAFLAEHYTDGIPEKICRRSTFRDLVRKDNIRQQQEKFVLRGKLEEQAVKKLTNVIGRTDWDREKTAFWNPDIQYHFCNETLREPFYEGRWEYDRCTKHRIFASSCSYPIKGFHYLLEAFADVVKNYPDATLTVTGRTFLPQDFKGKLRCSSYEAYMASLARKYRICDKIQFLGDLSAEDMKKAYLDANVFVLSSTMENSPNVLGEAMLLGMPCIASGVGGVRNLVEHNAEGFVYPSGDVSALAEHIKAVFAMEDGAAAMGEKAREHALQTHDPEKNLQDLLKIYETIR